MYSSSSAFAPLHPDSCPPRIIPLDVSGDGLACFSSESTRAAAPEPAMVPAGPAGTPHPFVRVPRGVGVGALALLAGAFCGMAIAAVVSPADRPPLGVGKVTVTSDPPGAAVEIDGVARGLTPLTAVLDVGAHHLAIGDGTRARPQLLRVTPGGSASLHVEWVGPLSAAAPPPEAGAATAVVTADGASVAPKAIRPRPAPGPGPKSVTRAAAAPPPVRRPPTGWLVVKSPFPVRVLHDGVDVGGSADGRLSLSAGTSTVVLVNEALEFRDEREVTVAANRSVSLAVETPSGVLHANARPWAEVWVDGRLSGDTPLGNLSLPIGEHDVVFRHPQLGELRQQVTVGARTPARVSVEFQP